MSRRRDNLINSATIALVAVCVLIIACCSDPALSRPLNPPIVLVLSAVNVTMQGQPETIGCPQRGWTVQLANGTRVEAAAVAYDPATRATEVRPAAQDCVLKDSFE